MSAPLLIAMGTRPEFVKLAPIIKELERREVATHLVVTGQHWDEAMRDSFLDGIEPDEVWPPPTGAADRLAVMASNTDATLARVRPAATVVLGDTHTVPLFALSSRRAGIPVVHVEAGLRSLNPQSIEEMNRKVASALASLHFAPTDVAAEFLRREGIDEERIRVVGNTAIDALHNLGLDQVPAPSRSGVLVTAHRPTNVDGPGIFDLVDSIIEVHRNVGPVRFPVHPRTRARLVDTGLEEVLRSAGVALLDPVGHEDLLDMLRHSELVVTDSGGLQEEAAYFAVPAVVLRRSTPRWEGIAAGIAALSRLDAQSVLSAADHVRRTAAIDTTLYGDGKAAVRIADVLTDPDVWRLLSLDEPDFTDGSLPEAASAWA